MDENQSEQPYRVLARKYRPRTFAELIGQDAMVRTLTNAIAADRLPHAFILTGVRGVGKTSTARIIARALNCIGEDGNGGPTADPCGVCEHCVAITEDRHVDVIEMDAASRTGVDDIRELIDGVRYRPVNARYKIYIIDEVHMLSKNAFNALLKTLEEPPEHVKFLFATTETRRVPVTVLSRCQRFDLRRVDIPVLSAHFASIAEQEGIAISEGAIGLVARAADGSVRDGLSLLDQAIAHAGGADSAEGVGEEIVRDMLGLVDGGKLYDLFEAAMGGKASEALDAFADMHNSGADPAQVLEDLLQLTHWLSRLKLSPAAAQAAGVSQMDAERGSALAEKLSMPVLGRTWQLLVKGLGEVRMAPSAGQAAEMVLIRLAYMADMPPPADVIRKLTSGAAESVTPAGGAPASAPARPSGNGGATAMTGGGAAPALRPDEPPAPETAPETAPDTMPQAALAEPSPAGLPMPGSFEEVVALFDEKREALLHAHLVNRVHLVGFQPGHIELRAQDDAPGDLANRVIRLLNEWTGENWLVSLSDEPGAETLGNQRRAAAEVRRGEAIGHPLVQEALSLFPGATVEAVVEREEPTLDELPPAPDDDEEEEGNGL